MSWSRSWGISLRGSDSNLVESQACLKLVSRTLLVDRQEAHLVSLGIVSVN